MTESINLIVVAMEEELAALLKGIGPYRTERCGEDIGYVFQRSGEDYVIVRGRIGKVSTAFHIGRLAALFRIRRIFNLGTSGSVSEGLKIGDVVLATSVCYHDVDVTGFGYPPGQVPGFPAAYACDRTYLEKPIPENQRFRVHRGEIASGDSFVMKKNCDRFFLKERRPLCVEMEAGAIGQCAHLLGIPFTVIRSVSDYALKEGNETESTGNIAECCANCAQVLLAIL